jgi:hypothetical protein
MQRKRALRPHPAGEEDERCPKGQSEELFVTLVRGGAPPLSWSCIQGQTTSSWNQASRRTAWIHGTADDRVERWVTEDPKSSQRDGRNGRNDSS